MTMAPDPAPQALPRAACRLAALAVRCLVAASLLAGGGALAQNSGSGDDAIPAAPEPPPFGAPPPAAPAPAPDAGPVPAPGPAEEPPTVLVPQDAPQEAPEPAPAPAPPAEAPAAAPAARAQWLPPLPPRRPDQVPPGFRATAPSAPPVQETPTPEPPADFASATAQRFETVLETPRAGFARVEGDMFWDDFTIGVEGRRACTAWVAARGAAVAASFKEKGIWVPGEPLKVSVPCTAPDGREIAFACVASDRAPVLDLSCRLE